MLVASATKLSFKTGFRYTRSRILAKAFAVIEISINGNPRSLPAGLTVEALLIQMELAGKRVAVEKNGEIVPKGRHAQTQLAAGDALEIVVAVGGG